MHPYKQLEPILHTSQVWSAWAELVHTHHTTQLPELAMLGFRVVCLVEKSTGFVLSQCKLQKSCRIYQFVDSFLLNWRTCSFTTTITALLIWLQIKHNIVTVRQAGKQTAKKQCECVVILTKGFLGKSWSPLDQGKNIQKHMLKNTVAFLLAIYGRRLFYLYATNFMIFTRLHYIAPLKK